MTGGYVVVEDIPPFRLKRKLRLETERSEGGGVLISNEEADLYASGDTLDDALEDLAAELGIAWREYALCDDAGLDEVARTYRRWLLDNVEGPSA